MRTKILLLSIIATFFITGCKKTEVDFIMGEGTIVYEGKSYSLDFATISTYPLEEEEQEGIYRHNIIVTNTKEDLAFSISVKDTNADNEINPGEYKTSLNGQYTAHYSIEGTGDYLEGTIMVSRSGDKHVLTFEGTTIDNSTDTKTVKFNYSGDLEDKD